MSKFKITATRIETRPSVAQFEVEAETYLQAEDMGRNVAEGRDIKFIDGPASFSRTEYEIELMRPRAPAIEPEDVEDYRHCMNHYGPSLSRCAGGRLIVPLYVCPHCNSSDPRGTCHDSRSHT